MKTIGKVIIGIILLSGCSAVVTERPPDHQIAVIPAAPGAGFVWVNDSWAYDRRAHVYQSSRGHWIKPKKATAVWVDGYWIQTRKGWKYIDGHWRIKK